MGATTDETVLAATLQQIERFAQVGAGAWRSAGLDTSCLRNLPKVASQLAQRTTPRSEGSDSSEPLEDAIEAAIEAAIKVLSEPFQCAATAFFGFNDKPPTPATKDYRSKLAAEKLGRSDRWFRAPCQKPPYNGKKPALWLVSQVAAALVIPDPPDVGSDDRNESSETSHDSANSNSCVPQDVYEHYRQTPRSDLYEYGFFERESTTRYIDDLAQLADRTEAPITIYAGISADAGNEPRRRQVMERLLRQLIERSELVKEAATEADRDYIAKRVSHSIAENFATTYLGSIVRELTRRGTNEHHPSAEELRAVEESLRYQIRDLLATGTVPGRYAATAIAACAFAMRRAGAIVRVITSNYDDVLAREVRHIHLPSYLPVKDYRFVTISSNGEATMAGLDDDILRPTEVSFTQLNGSLGSAAAAPLILGEGDFFAEYNHGLQLAEAHSRWRHSLLTRLLKQTACIFVGSTLTDPDVLEHLARTKHRHRRYALLLEPNVASGSDTSETEGAKPASVVSLERYVGREMIAQRYLHLGVVPIIVEHPHQISQLLREVALKILQGAAYKSYSVRSKHWWGYWAKAFGHKSANSSPGPRSVSLQEHWRTKPLAEALKHLRKVIADGKKPQLDDEQMVLEVWLRNPYQRDLVLWARSDSHWLDAATAHHGTLRGEGNGYVVQRVFQQGRSGQIPLTGQPSQWRYAWSIPLVLSREPWYHLPVGVLNVLSNKAENEPDGDHGVTKFAKLLNIADPAHNSRDTVEKLERSLKRLVLSELDPQTTTWKAKELPDWKTYTKRLGRKG